MNQCLVNLGQVSLVKLDNIFFAIVREVTTGPGPCHVKLGRPAGRNGGGAIRVEKLEGLDAVEEDLAVRKPRDIRTRDISGNRGRGKIFVGGELGG